jgi:hypothetical protein
MSSSDSLYNTDGKINFYIFIDSIPLIAMHKNTNDSDFVKIFYILEKMSLSEGVKKSLNRNQNLYDYLTLFRSKKKPLAVELKLLKEKYPTPGGGGLEKIKSIKSFTFESIFD